MNQIIIEGNLGSDPELKVFGDETLATFSLAHTPRKKVNNQWQDGDTIWFRVTFWNSKADNVLDTLRKGEKVMVAGKLAQSKFTGKDGVEKTSLEIAGTNFYLVARGKGSSTAAPTDFFASVPAEDAPGW